jgi:hypothetical protein
LLLPFDLFEKPKNNSKFKWQSSNGKSGFFGKFGAGLMLPKSVNFGGVSGNRICAFGIEKAGVGIEARRWYAPKWEYQQGM